MSEEIRTKEEILCEQNKQHLSVGEKLILEVLINIRDQNIDIIEWLDSIDSSIVEFNNDFNGCNL